LSIAQRKFFTEVAALVDKSVIVAATTGKTYSGTLIGVNPDTLSLCLAEAKDEKGKTLHRVFLNGNVVAQILSVEKPFDLKSLAERLIWVMDRVKLTEKGVMDGSGPAADRVQKVYEQFISEMKG